MFNQASAQEKVKLEALSDQGTFVVEIFWTQNDIGDAHTFDIRFIDPETDELIEDVKYNFSIFKGSDRKVTLSDQVATQQEFTFEEIGPYEIRIDNIEGLGESVKIPIQVTPEFPVGLFVLAVAVGLIILIAGRNSYNLFRQMSR